MKVTFTYKHIDQPWGGANNFLRALYRELTIRGRFEITHSMDQDVDLVFMNQLGLGPGGGKFQFRQLESFLKPEKSRKKKIVVRAVNLNLHAHKLGLTNVTKGLWEDLQTIRLLNIADEVIFQSEYQKRVFELFGYRGKKYSVIHNGAAQDFLSPVPLNSDLSHLRLISTGSDRYSKNHHLLAELSRISGVEVIYYGGWPKNLNAERVQFRGKGTHAEISEAMKKCHYFVFAAVKEMCPNSVVEALASGLPVIYNPAKGSNGELVGPFGVALNPEDLQQTVEKARGVYFELYRKLEKEREEYQISKVADSYIKVFERALEGENQ